MIIAFTGLAGSGKDSAADALVARRGFVKISLADPLKRICQTTFGWGRDRLWGSSERRNEPDPAWDGLTARRALQTLGAEWGRAMHPDVWVRRCISDAKCRIRYTSPPCAGVVIPDVRFANEVSAIRKAGGRVVRIVRDGAGLDGAAGAHASETGIADLDVDFTLHNDGDLGSLLVSAVELPELVLGNTPEWK